MDATREGVPEQDQDTTEEQPAIIPGSPGARRLDAMDMISKSRTAALEMEIGESVTDEPQQEAADEPRDEPRDEPDSEKEAEPEGQIDKQLAQDEFLDPSMFGRKVRMKVDGQEVVVPLEQVLRTAQKSEAADLRLQRATELLRAAQSRAEETTGSIEPSAKPGPSQDETVMAQLKAAVDAIFAGDDNAATEALAQVLAKQQQPAAPQVDPDKIADVVAQRLDERSALDRFLDAYPRIRSNPWLQAAADAALAHFQSEGKPFGEALDAAGKAVYLQFGYEQERAEKKGPEPTTTRRETLERRKAGMDIPTGRTVSTAATQVSPESSEAQRSLTISEMAAARRGEIRPRG